jgi:hypothetical protein
VTFEEYRYWADRSREHERTLQNEKTIDQLKKLMSGKKKAGETTMLPGVPYMAPPEPHAGEDSTRHTEDNHGPTELDWERAQRATRTATWISIFYLITTDILGRQTISFFAANSFHYADLYKGPSTSPGPWPEWGMDLVWHSTLCLVE